MADFDSLFRRAVSFDEELNDFASEGLLTLADMAYPNHDGNADAEVVSDLMFLRDRLKAIRKGCEVYIKHISDVVDKKD